MRIEQRNVYIAEDGQEFDSEDACKEHEKWHKLLAYVYSYSDDFDAEGVTQFLVDRWVDLNSIIEGNL